MKGADHAVGGKVDADGAQAGIAQGGEGGMDHVAAGGRDDDLELALARRADLAEHRVIHHGLVERHRDLVRRAETDRGLELVLVVDHRQPDRADRDLLVGEPEPNRPREAVSVNISASVSPSASGSVTSPSWTTPAGTSAIAAVLT